MKKTLTPHSVFERIHIDRQIAFLLRHTSDGTLANPLPSPSILEVSRKNEIPIYAADGTSQGFRSLETARLLLANGYVKAAYGRKGHLKAIWLQQHDGGNPIQTQARLSTKYSVIERLQHGRCWKLRCLDRRDDDGVLVNTRGVFQQVLKDCLVR